MPNKRQTAAFDLERLRATGDVWAVDPAAENLGQLMLDAAKEIDRLQNLIKHLPRTADSVPVVPGVDYWCSWEDQQCDGEFCTEVRKCRYVGHASPHVDYDWEIEDCPWGGCESPPGFDVYSTRKAAEAARDA